MSNVIDFDAARERMALTSEPPENPILMALDAFGLALAEHDHIWTERERDLYETAVAYLTGSS